MLLAPPVPSGIVAVTLVDPQPPVVVTKPALTLTTLSSTLQLA
jgi:hypothetical protein